MDNTQVSQAYAETLRVKSLSAFNLQGVIEKRKLNQHATLYRFTDNSYIQVNHHTSRAIAWQGAFGKRIHVPLAINQRWS